MTPDPLTRRVAAAQATVDAFAGKPFKWGTSDCARLAAFCLKQLGYQPRLSRFGFYKSALSASRALTREGFTDVVGWMDDLGLPRIAPAAALPGDIVGFGHPDQALRVGLTIAVGNGRIFGFSDAFEDGPRAAVLAPNFALEDVEYFAWRADPCPS